MDAKLRWIVVITGAGLSACFSGLVDTDGLAASADAGNGDAATADVPDAVVQDAPDASDAHDVQDAPDSSMPDADASDPDAQDVSTPDAHDAPSDTPADTPPDTTPVAWCEANGAGALFCDDFDGATVWDDYVISPKATLALSTAQSSSPPRSLAFATEVLTAEGTGEAYRVKSFGTTAAPVVWSYDALVKQVPPQGASILAQMVLRDGSDNRVRLSLLIEVPYVVTLEVETRLSGQAATYAHYPLAVEPPSGVWSNVTHTVSSSPRKLSIRINDAPAIDGLALSMLSGASVDGEVRVGGCYVAAPSEPWQFFYDNVLLR
jgi:hypothetical protein